MKQGETKFKERFRKRLDEIPKSAFIKIQMVALRGVPDFIGVVNGWFVALELKTEEGKVDKLQAWWLDRLAKAGAHVWTVRPSNADEVIEDLALLAERKGVGLRP